jgi:hypothetical protein
MAAAAGRWSPDAVTVHRGSAHVLATSFSGATLVIQSSTAKPALLAWSTAAASSRRPGEYRRQGGANRPSKTR